MAKLPIAIIFIAILTHGVTQSDTDCDEHEIINKLFLNYNTDIRPVRKHSTPVIVQVQVYIEGITDINEQEESISFLLWIKSVWKDEYLHWDLNEPDKNCSEIKIRANKLWTPNPIFINTLDMTPIVPPDQQRLQISNEGIINMTTTAFVTLRCPMSISDFPFDTQKCPMYISTWTYEYEDLQFTLYDPTPGLEDIAAGSSEFQTVSFDAVVTNDSDKVHIYSQVHYMLVLKRIPEYYVYVIIIPSVLLTSICIIGIFTPNSNINERNERVTLGLTTLLSMAVILNIVADQMPKSSQGLPLLGYFVLYEIVMCTLSIILATTILFVHQRAHTRAWRPPRILFWLTQTKQMQNDATSPSYFDNYGAVKEEEKHLQSANRKEFIEEYTGSDKVSQMFTMVKKSCEKFEAISSMIEKKMQHQEREEIKAKVWMKTVDLIDSCLLIVLFIANIIIVGVVFR